MASRASSSSSTTRMLGFSRSPSPCIVTDCSGPPAPTHHFSAQKLSLLICSPFPLGKGLGQVSTIQRPHRLVPARLPTVNLSHYRRSRPSLCVKATILLLFRFWPTFSQFPRKIFSRP